MKPLTKEIKALLLQIVAGKKIDEAQERAVQAFFSPDDGRESIEIQVVTNRAQLAFYNEYNEWSKIRRGKDWDNDKTLDDAERALRDA